MKANKTIRDFKRRSKHNRRLYSVIEGVKQGTTTYLTITNKVRSQALAQR